MGSTWSTGTVGEVAEQVRGVTYKKQDASNISLPNHVGIVRAGNIVNGELAQGGLVFVPRSLVSPKQLLRKGDVLVAASSGSLDVVGKAARIRSNQAVSFGAFCKVLRPKHGIDGGYFAHYFQTPQYRRYVAGVAAGANINNLTNGHLNEAEIPLPPIEEQRRIAAVLDAADALRTKRRQALAKLDTLTQAIFIDMFGDFRDRPREPLLRYAAAITKGTTPTSIGFDFSPSGVPFVRVQDMSEGSVKFEQIELFITTETDAALGRSRLRPGDVLVSIAGTIGRTAIVPADAPDMNCNQAVALIRTDSGLMPEFLERWLRSEDARRQIAGAGVTGTISNLSLGSIRNLVLPIPPASEQIEFRDRAILTARKVQLQRQSLAQLDALFASLQQRAFRGEL